MSVERKGINIDLTKQTKLEQACGGDGTLTALHHICDYIMDRLKAKANKNVLPWDNKDTSIAKDGKISCYSYMLTIYALNQIEGTLGRFLDQDLNKWKVLPIFSNFVMPEHIKFDDAVTYVDILDRSFFEVNETKIGQDTDNGYIMNVDQFNDFTNELAHVFKLSADKLATFESLRTKQTIAGTIDVQAYNGKTHNPEAITYPVTLSLVSAKKQRIDWEDSVMDYLRDNIDQKYSNAKGGVHILSNQES